MEALRDLVWEFWNYALLTYRTTLIKAESKRRKAIANTQDRSNKCRKVNLLLDRNEIEIYTESQSIITASASSRESQNMIIADVSSTYNCDRSEMKRVFDLFDQDKDGRISAEELKLFMQRLGFELSDQKVKDMVGAVDKNRDDSVDIEEFFSLYSTLWAMGEDCNILQCTTFKEDDDEEGTLLKAFFVFDENKDGLISAVELQQVLLKLGLSEGRSLMGCQKMIERVDADGNGKVDFFEFKEMMCSTALSLPICKA